MRKILLMFMLLMLLPIYMDKASAISGGYLDGKTAISGSGPLTNIFTDNDLTTFRNVAVNGAAFVFDSPKIVTEYYIYGKTCVHFFNSTVRNDSTRIKTITAQTLYGGWVDVKVFNVMAISVNACGANTTHNLYEFDVKLFVKLPPIDLGTTNITATSATLNFKMPDAGLIQRTQVVKDPYKPTNDINNSYPYSEMLASKNVAKSYNVKGLKPNTTYTLYLRLIYDTAESTFIPITFKTTRLPSIYSPLTPTATTNITTSGATLNWTNPVVNVDGDNYVSLAGTVIKDANGNVVGELDKTTTNFDVTGAAAENLTYTLYSIYADGTLSSGRTVTVQLLAPSIYDPVAPKFTTDITNNSATFNWINPKKTKENYVNFVGTVVKDRDGNTVAEFGTETTKFDVTGEPTQEIEYIIYAKYADGELSAGKTFKVKLTLPITIDVETEVDVWTLIKTTLSFILLFSPFITFGLSFVLLPKFKRLFSTLASTKKDQKERQRNERERQEREKREIFRESRISNFNSRERRGEAKKGMRINREARPERKRYVSTRTLRSGRGG